MSYKDFGELAGLPKDDLVREWAEDGPYERAEALDLVDRIETWGRTTLYLAIDKADRGSARQAHSAVAKLLESLSQSVAGQDANRIRKLADYWKLIGDSLPDSPSTSPSKTRRPAPGTTPRGRGRESINTSIDHTAAAPLARLYNPSTTGGPWGGR
jgi:hypothetical protein